MNALQIILAILPGILICLYILYRDRHDREPIILLLICFAAGVGSSFPAILMEEFGFSLGIRESENMLDTFTLAFAGVAFPEELVKYVCLMLFAYPWKAFDEPLDGIVYSVMVSMGFATIENIIYANIYALDTTILRMFTAVPAHAAFAIFMGYHVGIAKFTETNKSKFKHLFLGFAGAVVLHGAYDFFLLQRNIPELSILAMVILLICIFYTKKLVKLHEQISKQQVAEKELVATSDIVAPASHLEKQASATQTMADEDSDEKKSNWDNLLK